MLHKPRKCLHTTKDFHRARGDGYSGLSTRKWPHRATFQAATDWLADCVGGPPMDHGRGPGRLTGATPNVVNEELFRFLIDLEVSKASRLQYCVSLICVSPSEGEEQMGPAFAHRAAGAVSRHFRATDVVSSRAPASIFLLLVAAETRDLPEIFRRTASELEAHEAIGGPTQSTVWIGGGSCYPQTATSGPELWGQTAKLTTEARRKRAGTLILPA
jgi:hypothetical protein